MDKTRFLLFTIGLLGHFLFAQEEPELLTEVLIVSDTPLRDFSETQQVIHISDSVLRKSQSSLTSLLNFNSGIYFKENGLGMVSSPSFRGTTASQTAVVWNGININSLSTGQTDFNTINIRGFDNIAVKSGGGSVAYGSGAIGGSVHLNNDIKFNNKTTQRLFANYGSFDIYGIDFSSKIASDRTSISVGLTRNASDNDYPFPKSERKNINGQFYNNNLNIALGYRLNDNHILKFYGNIFEGERHFSVPTPNAMKTKYRDFNLRNMAEWTGYFGRFTSRLKLAYLTEEYRYFPNIDSDTYTFGETDSKIVKYDLAMDVKSNIKVNLFLDYSQNQGRGSSIQSDTRQIGSASLMLKHHLTSKLLYELTLKQEITDVYESPFLYSLGLKYEVSGFYHIKTHISRNFRIPTFNDMYWEGSGNPDLLPEISNQAEITHIFTYNNIRLSVTGYYNVIKDMLRWIPVSGSLWRPENVDSAKMYGLESVVGIEKRVGENHFQFSGTYTYTVSENSETGKQLIYVPYHKATASLSFSRKRFTTYYQFLYNGEVFTTTDNNTAQILDSYLVSNIGLEYDFGRKNSYTIGFQALNLWNEDYQSMLNRPMPGRNFNIYINLKF